MNEELLAYWQNRGVDLRSATLSKLKKAWIREIKKSHPDPHFHNSHQHCQTHTEATQMLNQMYERAKKFINQRREQSVSLAEVEYISWKMFDLSDEQAQAKKEHLRKCQALLKQNDALGVNNLISGLEEALQHDIDIRQINARAYLKRANYHAKRLEDGEARKLICLALWNFPYEAEFLKRCKEIFNYEGKIRERDQFIIHLKHEYRNHVWEGHSQDLDDMIHLALGEDTGNLSDEISIDSKNIEKQKPDIALISFVAIIAIVFSAFLGVFIVDTLNPSSNRERIESDHIPFK